MKLWVCTLLLVSVLTTGCASRYKLTLTNDVTIITASKPKLDKETNTYRFKDAKGQTQSLPAFKVQVIERL